MLLKCTPANVNSMYFRIFLGVFILYLKYLSKKKKKKFSSSSTGPYMSMYAFHHILTRN
jgi:hypothetical protein